MSCNSGCPQINNIGNTYNKCNVGNFGLEYLPNSTINYIASSTSTIGANTIQMILSVGNVASTYTGPPDDSSGDGYLVLQ